MKERTESEIFSKAPIKVTLGDKEFPIKPLSINKAQAWRGKFNEATKEILSNMNVEDVQASFGSAMTAALLRFPEKVIELVGEWSAELATDVNHDEATEEQYAHAFTVIMCFAYPYLAPLALSMQVAAKSR